MSYIKRFGVDNDFTAYAIDGYLLAVCWGGTAFAKKFTTWNNFDELLAPLLSKNETQVIYYCQANEWYIYDYYNDQILDYSSGTRKVIDDLSKSIGHNPKRTVPLI